MAKWTDAEREALEATAHLSGMEGYRAFVQLGGGGKPFNAWEVKRRRLAVAPERITIPLTAPVIVPLGDFKGLSTVYFDIETTFSMEPVVLYAAGLDAFNRLERFEAGPDWTDDRQMVRDYAEYLQSFDIVVSWNGKLFDVPVLNARLAYWKGIDGKGPRRLDLNMHIDLMYYATGQFMRIGRKSLQNVSEYFEVANEKTPLRVRQWNGAMAGKAEDYAKIREHCDADVAVLRDVFPVLKQHVRTIHRGG